MNVKVDGSEMFVAWERLRARYGARWVHATRINGTSRLEPNGNVSWLYVGTREIHGDWWHEFCHPDHPRFGRIQELIPASDGWAPAPST